jgi:hypothetical protein
MFKVGDIIYLKDLLEVSHILNETELHIFSQIPKKPFSFKVKSVGDSTILATPNGSAYRNDIGLAPSLMRLANPRPNHPLTHIFE